MKWNTREKNKSSILVANKGDVKGSELKLYEFYELGFGDPYIISAEHGLNNIRVSES